MDTNFEPAKRESIQVFGERNNLVMTIRERTTHKDPNMRFFACFDRTEVKEGCCLSGIFGNGSTPEAAVAQYARRISSQELVVDAFRKRREIFAPILSSDPSWRCPEAAIAGK